MIRELYEIYKELGDFLLTENLTDEQFNKLSSIREKLYPASAEEE